MNFVKKILLLYCRGWLSTLGVGSGRNVHWPGQKRLSLAGGLYLGASIKHSRIPFYIDNRSPSSIAKHGSNCLRPITDYVSSLPYLLLFYNLPVRTLITRIRELPIVETKKKHTGQSP